MVIVLPGIHAPDELISQNLKVQYTVKKERGAFGGIGRKVTAFSYIM
jgi:hypothetical protein